MSEAPSAATLTPSVRPSVRPQDLPAALIVNAKARKGQEWFTQAQDCLKQKGVQLLAAHELHDPSHMGEKVDEVLDQGAKLVIVGGGDGSFRSVIGRLVKKDAVLGVLPLGTVNDFARNLGIAPTVEAACDVIAHGRIERIDFGQANDEYFVITASVGFSAQTQVCLTPNLKRFCGPFGYLVASFLAIRKLHKLRLKIRMGETEETLPVLQAGVVNGHSWMGGKFEIPGKDLESGRLAFYAVPVRNGWRLLHLARDLSQGRFWHTQDLVTCFTEDVTLETDTPQQVVLDGDLCGKTPVRLRLICGALQVCVPADYNPAHPDPRAESTQQDGQGAESE